MTLVLVLCSPKRVIICVLRESFGVNNRKFSIYEKEVLTLMMAIDKWRSYMQCGSFTILIDHKSLVSLQDHKLTSDLDHKAMAKMVCLQFDIKYNKSM